MAENIRISVFIINFNGRKTVLETIASLLDSRGVDVDIHVLDDCSTDGSPELIRQRYPNISISIEERNTVQPNSLRNKALKSSKTDIVFITDNDLIFEPDCLYELYRHMKDDPAVATCRPRLMYLGDEDRLYVGESKIHYLGLSVDDGRGEKVNNIDMTPKQNSGSGVMLIRKQAVEEVGGFDEEYLLGWGDDGEFHHRFLLAGWKCLYIPTACCYHEHKPFSPLRHYRAQAQLYNRWRFILTHYAPRTLAVIAPALLLFELMQLCFFIMKKMLLIYLKGNALVIRDLRRILKKRKQIQSMRKVSDRTILFSGPIYVGPEVYGNNTYAKRLIELIGRFYSMYWSIASKLL